MLTPAVLYAAKSTEDKHGSIPTQLADGRTMAEQEGWEVVYQDQDEGFSAYSGNRGPGLERARRAAMQAAEERGVPCMLVAQHSDRFARGAGDKPGAADSLVEIWHAMRRQNVHLRSVKNDAMLSDPLLVAAASKLAHEESQRKSDAVKSGMKRAREAGRWTGGRLAYGTKVRDGEQVPDPSMVPVVKRMFAEYVAGRSQQDIVRGLRKDNVPTSRGGAWHQGTVRNILANEVYMRLGIIDADIWAKAETTRTAQAKSPGGGRGRPLAGQHLFRKGMLRCGECAGAMVPRTDPNRKQAPRETYYCYGRKQDPDSCSMPPIPRALIDSAVYTYFERVGLDVEATRQQLADSRDHKLTEIRALREDAEKQAARLDAEAQRVERDYRAGDLSAKRYEPMIAGVDADQEAVSAKVEQLRDREQEVTDWGEFEDVEGDMLGRFTDLRKAIAGEVKDAQGIDAVRAALTRLFEQFYIYGPAIGGWGSDLDQYFADGWRIKEIDSEMGGDEQYPDEDLSHTLPARLDDHLYLIDAFPRLEVVEGYDRMLSPILRREPLHQAENNYAKGFGR